MTQTLKAPQDSAMQHLLRCLDGQAEGRAWLEQHRPGLACLTRSLNGGPKARQRLTELTVEQWDHVFEAVVSEELGPHLRGTHNEVSLLFAAVRGDEGAIQHLHKHKPSFFALAGIIREAHERSLAGAAVPHNGEIDDSEAADVGCLIGEMHLSKGEYQKAVEAFTRAIDNAPTADALEGRARAYHALAAEDEVQAARLREEKN
jgi:tetratricopeptide (TPR) repeat protein